MWKVISRLIRRHSLKVGLCQIESSLLLHVLEGAPNDQMYSRSLDIVLEALDSPSGVFGYFDTNGNWITPSISGMWDKCKVTGKSIVFPAQTIRKTPSWGYVIKEKTTLVKNQSCEVPEGHIPIDRLMIAPILDTDDDLIGMLAVANKERDYSTIDKMTLEAIAEIIAPVLKKRLARKKSWAWIVEGVKRHGKSRYMGRSQAVR